MKTFVLAALLLSVALPATAGELYKCTNAKGDITFSDVACPQATSTIETRSVERGRATSTADGIPPPGARGDAPVTSSTLPNDPEGKQGFRCSGGGKVWLQKTPCPATVAAAPRSRPEEPDSQPIATVRADDAGNAGEAKAARDAACRRALDDLARQSKGLTPAAETYERNKILRERC